MSYPRVFMLSIFQSTLSMRRATSSAMVYVLRHIISIHALHEESDGGQYTVKNLNDTFQSTLSMRRATECFIIQYVCHLFQSTLSMRRATRETSSRRVAVGDFNPRSP